MRIIQLLCLYIFNRELIKIYEMPDQEMVFDVSSSIIYYMKKVSANRVDVMKVVLPK